MRFAFAAAAALILPVAPAVASFTSPFQCGGGCAFEANDIRLDAGVFDSSFISTPERKGSVWIFEVVTDDPNASFLIGGPGDFQQRRTIRTETGFTSELNFGRDRFWWETRSIGTSSKRVGLAVTVQPSLLRPLAECQDLEVGEVCSEVNELIFNSSPWALRSNTPGTLYFRSLAIVPEPASWAMMIGGFGLVGGALRARPRPRATTLA